MTPEPTPAVAPPEAAQASAPQSFFARLSGVYFTPGETFAGFKFDTKKFVPILAPILLTMIMGSLNNYLVTERVGYENVVRKSIEPMKEMMGEQAYEEALRQAANRSTAAKVRDAIIPFIGALIVLLAVAGIIKLLTMIMGAENKFSHLLSVVAYVFVALGIIQTILYIVILYLKSPDEIDIYNPIGSNLGAVLPLISSGLPKFVTSLAAWIDVFGFWRIALLSIGAAAVSRRLKTSTIAILLAILYGLAALAISGVSSMFGS